MAQGFSVTHVMSGLERPTAVRFGPTGRVWVAEQAGRLKVFEGTAGDEPMMSADLTDRVYGRNNRGLLGLAPDPADDGAAYVLYTFPAPPGVDEPVWDDSSANCPDGSTRSCVSTGVLSRVAFGADGSASETVLVRGWCHHHASHAPDDLAFGPDGALYVSSGEGSVPELDIDDGSWLPPDQRCNEGAFASRADPTERGPGAWAGTVVRFAAADMAAVAGGEQSPEWLAGRAAVVAFGLRNPFRMTFRPATAELWIGDAGWHTWEEINVVQDATDATADDFGWPCREGHEAAANYAADPRCAALTADPARAVEPWFVERTGVALSAGDGCPTAPSSISGIAFGPSRWPVPYGDAVYFADFSRGCVYVIPVAADGSADVPAARALWAGAGSAVDLTRGPDEALYVARFGEGVVSRITRSGD